MTKQENRDFWLAHIEAWKQSGQRQLDYIEQHGLKRHAFGYWVRKYNRHLALSSVVKLVPVRREQALLAQALTLNRVDGWRLSIPAGTSAQWLGDLLRSL
jgi:uncharacterized protein YceH (UPF0502 family)